MSRNVIPSDGRHSEKELDADLTVPAGAVFTELQSKINVANNGDGLRIDGADELVVRVAVVGSMPAGSEVVVQPILHGFVGLTPISLTLGAIIDGIVEARLENNDTFRDADLLKVTYEFKQGGAQYLVSAVNLQVKKKSSLDPVIAPETTEDLEWHIDPVAGSDETGTGSASQPFKTFACLDRLPFTIKNEVKIKPKAGAYSYFPEYYTREFFGNGRIVIDSSGETYPVTAGPFTIGTVTGVGDAYQGYPMATDLQVTGSPGWTPDDYYPKFIHILTGNWAGYVLPIFKNTADTIRTSADWYTFAPGDTFNIVDCPTVIDIPDSTYWRGNVARLMDFTGVAYKDAPMTPVLLMSGVKIRANSVKQKRSPFKFQDITAVFSFCAFINEDDVSPELSKNILSIFNMSLNGQILETAAFDNNKCSDWYAYAFQVSQKEGDPRDNVASDIEIANCLLALTCCRGGIWPIAKPGYEGGGFVSYSMCGAIVNNASGYWDIGPVFLEQIGFSDVAIEQQMNGRLKIRGVYLENCGTPVKVAWGAGVSCEWFKGNTIGGQYALEIEDVSNFIIEGANCSVLGTLGAYKFLFTGTTSATWPGAGASDDDGAGSFVLRKP